MLDTSRRRPSWDETFLTIADAMSLRATCPRLSVGAVLVKDKAPLTMGYNGAPTGLPHCLDEGCLMINGHCKRALHAERNVLIWAARRGPAIEGADLYLTHSPCLDCLMHMIQCKVNRVIYRADYRPDPLVREYAERGGIALIQYAVVR